MTELVAVNPKETSQNALLEVFLTNLRTRRVLKYVKGKSVLDYGCGIHLKTLRSMEHLISRGCGYDILFKGMDQQTTKENFNVVGDPDDLHGEFDCVTSLACFEHIDPAALPDVLRSLLKITHGGSKIIGTVPRPPARIVLEFLSYRLGLIDKTQIEDHQVYYDKEQLVETIENTGWHLTTYKTFQFRLNSFFVLERKA